MEQQIKLGLIGKNISYSFSQNYFEQKFKTLGLNNISYTLFDLENISKVEDLFAVAELRGFNVTIPYKEKIIPYLDQLSPEAADIGAVNTVLIIDGKKTGFNTDVFGFEKTLLKFKKFHHKSALVLGDGGAAKAIKYILNKHKILFTTVSRRGELSFDNLSAEMVGNNDLIVQCTPVGTFPQVSDCLNFPFEALSEKHLVIDLIYNPKETEFLRKAREQNAETVNGENMLEQQAEKAWEIWNI